MACLGVQLGACAVYMDHAAHGTPVSGQYAVGESKLASIGRGRCSAAGVADLGAVWHFGQRRPAGGSKNTFSGTGHALAAHPGVPLRRMHNYYAGRPGCRAVGRPTRRRGNPRGFIISKK